MSAISVWIASVGGVSGQPGKASHHGTHVRGSRMLGPCQCKGREPVPSWGFEDTVSAGATSTTGLTYKVEQGGMQALEDQSHTQMQGLQHPSTRQCFPPEMMTKGNSPRDWGTFFFSLQITQLVDSQYRRS